MKRLLTISLALACSVAMADSQDLKTRMPEKTWLASGLDKLSSAELAALADWIDNRASTPAPTVATKPDSGPEIEAPKAASTREAFSAELVQPLETSGGRGTRYELSNGQVWQQTCDTKWSSTPKGTSVQLKPAIMGRWRMRVVSNNTFVTVKRVE